MRSRFLLWFIVLFAACGCGTPSLLITPVSNSNKLEEIQVEDAKGFGTSKIAIVEV